MWLLDSKRSTMATYRHRQRKAAVQEKQRKKKKKIKTEPLHGEQAQSNESM